MKILGYIFLAAGILYACGIISISLRNKNLFKEQKGSLKILAPAEVIIFILCSFGMPDYLLHTIEGKTLGILEDKELPPTLVASCIVPGALLAFGMLNTENAMDPMTLIIISACVAAGSFTGFRFVSRLDGRSIRKFMIIALILSLAVIVIRIIVSGGEPGTETGIHGMKLLIISILCFGSGFVNMFGIPMKPAWTAMFLIAGLNPVYVLSTVLVTGCVSPMAGGINVLRSGNYNMKMVLSATIFGSIGAVIGISIALSIPAAVLNILLIGTVVTAIAVMVKK